MFDPLSTNFIKPNTILVRMPNWLGDLVMATPILTDLRNQWPQAEITVICQGALGAVIQEDPHIDQFITFKGSSASQGNLTAANYASFLQKEKYDLGILLTNSFSSAWYFWKGKVKQRVGFRGNWRRFLLTHAVPFPENRDTQHLVNTYKNLLAPLGIPHSTTKPQLYLTENELEQAAQLLKQLGITSQDFIIGVNPGAAYGSAKCWLPERFKELTHQLLKHPTVKILYFGDKNGQLLVDQICCNMPERVINLAAKTQLRQLIALIQKCHLFLTNDSGPMHVASALDVPLVALFGSTSDQTTGPYHNGLVIHKHVACSPCYKRQCPIDFRCMKQITVDEVYQSLQRWMKEAL